jgi:hypothetical protein
MAQPVTLTHLRFVDRGRKTKRHKTSTWHVYNRRNDTLGGIYWWPHWRQYIFEPASCIVLSADCLEEITDFVTQLNFEHKTRPAAPAPPIVYATRSG